ncbi:MAG: efflux RND transporter periplasmic adaptor subunit [Pirellulaceae bacterium]|nr:efflux RND transporter periplasmic adaptor subunit [Pirellulaceae bacterium]
MNRLAVWIGSFLVIAIVLAIGGTLGWLKYTEIKAAMAAPPPPENPIAVTLAEATSIDYRYNTTVIGTVLAPQSIMLSNEIPGTVSKLGFKSGDEVAENQKLVELDASVELARLKSATARLKIAESTLSRTRQAAKNLAVSELEVEEAESAYLQASAEIVELEATIAKKTLVAPFPSRIGLCNTHVGQFLASGSQIVTLQSLEGFINVDFMVPQSAADFIEVGNNVKLVDEQETYVATVAAIDAQADRSTRNLMVRARLSPVPKHLLPGDSVRVVIDYGPEMKTAAIPVEALRRAPMKTYVFVAETDEKGMLRAYERQIKVGQMIGDRFSVLSGLEVGVTVVADGSFKLREGALIAPITKTAPAANAVGQETAGK